MWAVYDIVSGGEIIYVGVSKNPGARWSAHKSRRVMPAGARMHVVRWYKMESRACTAERRRIARSTGRGSGAREGGPHGRDAKNDAF